MYKKKLTKKKCCAFFLYKVQKMTKKFKIKKHLKKVKKNNKKKIFKCKMETNPNKATTTKENKKKTHPKS